MRTLLVIAHSWSMLVLGASGDSGIPGQSRSVQLQIADYRPMSQRVPTSDEIRAALVEVLRAQKIPVTSDAKTHLWLELVESEKRDEEGVKACARVRSWIVEIGKEYLPKREVVTERCALSSQPKIPANGNINWIGVADAISRSSRKKDSLTDAYAEALGEVIANLKRTLDL
jgi:hypothetical protein